MSANGHGDRDQWMWLRADVWSAASARDAVREAVAEWGLPVEVGARAAQVAVGLVLYAVQHSHSRLSFRVAVENGAVVLEVQTDSAMPDFGAKGWERSPHLAEMRALADGHGITRRKSHRRLWASIPSTQEAGLSYSVG